MFISVLELFKIGIGPSSSHTMGPMVAARSFALKLESWFAQWQPPSPNLSLRCTLRGSLAYTGKGHATDRAVLLGLHGFTPLDVANQDVEHLVESLRRSAGVRIGELQLSFTPNTDIIFNRGEPLPEHPNGLIFEVRDSAGETLFSETYFSVGGGFVRTCEEMRYPAVSDQTDKTETCTWGFDSAQAMLRMADESGLSIAAMKQANELSIMTAQALEQGLDGIWQAMKRCLERGLAASGNLPGGLDIPRRARDLHSQLIQHPSETTVNDWLCAYAMAVNEENAAGSMVVTAPTNGAAGVIPAVLFRLEHDERGSREQIHNFLLTAAAIGGLIKYRSSISGAEVGCQGEVGAAAAMAAAGLCAARGGSPRQVENAAEIALEHHLGMTCDPVKGLVQIPCIERNGFGAIKAYSAASLALHGTGKHFVSLDNCIAAMKQTGQEMSSKLKETSLGGLAVSIIEC